jgi:LmbE family N-acetylglucosaminyl deacetylase
MAEAGADHVLYVSPHADDVAFSAAGQLTRDVAAGRRVTLLTLFEPAQDDGPRSFSDRAARRAEDEAFARACGVRLERAPFADAIVRRRRYRSPQKLFAPLAADEAPLVDEVRALLQAHVDGGCARVVAPLGVGGHVDHQIAHRASCGLSGCDLRFYEDTPYVLTPYQLPRRFARLDAEVTGERDPTLRRGTVRAELGAAASSWLSAPLIQDRVGPRLRKLAVATILTPEWTRWPRRSRTGARRFAAELLDWGELGEATDGGALIDVKLRAIDCYRSQWPLFYRTLDGWRDALERYGRAIGKGGAVERSWREVTPAAP